MQTTTALESISSEFLHSVSGGCKSKGGCASACASSNSMVFSPIIMLPQMPAPQVAADASAQASAAPLPPPLPPPSAEVATSVSVNGQSAA